MLKKHLMLSGTMAYYRNFTTWIYQAILWQVTQYADDIAIYTIQTNPRYLNAHFQKQVDELENWCEDWFIKLSEKKKQLVITSCQNSKKHIPINVKNNQVEINKLAVSLKTTRDRTMNLTPHTTNIINKTAFRIEK